MKKLVLLLITGLSFTFAQAQVQFGIKGGLNYSNIAGDLDNQDIYKNKIGFHGGISTSIPLMSDNFLSLNPELLYSQKGYQYRDDKFTLKNSSGQTIQNVERKGKVNFNYLDLPVLLKVNAGGLFFEGGPMLSYLVGVRDNTEETINGTENKTRRIVDKDNLSELEIGYVAGLGYMTPLGVSLGIRYNGGINKLAKENNDELTNARHGNFQLQLGFMLGGNQ